MEACNLPVVLDNIIIRVRDPDPIGPGLKNGSEKPVSGEILILIRALSGSDPNLFNIDPDPELVLNFLFYNLYFLTVGP